MSLKVLALINAIVLVVNLVFFISGVYYGKTANALVSLVGLAFCIRNVFYDKELRGW